MIYILYIIFYISRSFLSFHYHYCNIRRLVIVFMHFNLYVLSENLLSIVLWSTSNLGFFVVPLLWNRHMRHSIPMQSNEICMLVNSLIWIFSNYSPRLSSFIHSWWMIVRWTGSCLPFPQLFLIGLFNGFVGMENQGNL